MILTLALWLAVGLAACATGPQRGDPDIYMVAGLEVRIYQQQSTLARDIERARVIAPLPQIGNRRLEIRGYYDRAGRRIYSLDDARTLLHEIKHFLEPGWEHPLGAIWPEAR